MNVLAIADAIPLSNVWPELIVVIGGCAALIAGQGNRAARLSVQWIAMAAILVAGVIVRFQGAGPEGDPQVLGGFAFGGLNTLDGFVRLNALIVAVAMLWVLWSQPGEEERGEFFAMYMFTIAGLMLMGSAANLLTLFLALELVSIPTYVMIALSRKDPRALESATKYFYLGAMAAAMTAYGFSFLFGVAGSATIDFEMTTKITDALAAPGTTEHALATIGLLLSIAGLLFKIAAVPMHWYVADVYQGAASSVSGMLGFVPKFAGMVAIFKILLLTHWQTTSGVLFWMLWICAALSMTVGNVLALRQTNVKRMLAFSGVAHAGYMLVGVLVGPAADAVIGDGAAAVLYYVVVYGIANLGAFALLALLRVRGQACETLQDLAGLVRRYPGLALLMALSMLALMGLPPTTGFWGKMSLFGSGMALASHIDPALRSWVIALVIIAALNSAIGAAYYLRVTAVVLLYETEETADPAPRDALYMGAVLCGFLTIVLSIFPGLLFGHGTQATQRWRADVQDSRMPPTYDARVEPTERVDSLAVAIDPRDD